MSLLWFAMIAGLTLTCMSNAFQLGRHVFTSKPHRFMTDVKVEESPSEKLVYDPRSGRFYEKSIEEVCREEFCATDETTGEQVLLTVKEKERIFLDAIQTFYYSDRRILSDEDFEKLKEDLFWEGSEIVTLNRQETLFLNAMSSYLKGSPIMSDTEFDSLKSELKDAGSKVAVTSEPKCYIDTGICVSNFTEDKFRKLTLYTPVGVPTLLISLGTLYELVEPLKSVNPLLTLLIATLPTFFFTKIFTDNVFITNAKIAVGPCPSCGASNRIFFGNVLGVESFSDQAEFKCCNCKEEISIRKKDLRARTSPKV